MAGRPCGFKTATARAQHRALYDEAIAQSQIFIDRTDVVCDEFRKFLAS